MKLIEYPNLPSTIRPDNSFPVPKPLVTWSLDEAEDATMHESYMENDIDLDFEPFIFGEPHLITARMKLPESGT